MDSDELRAEQRERWERAATGWGRRADRVEETSRPVSRWMLELASARAREQGIENVEFKRLELEWIDLPAASVDALLCRWGLMLCVDPSAAASEMRRVLKPGGRLAVVVWDGPESNPWATVPTRGLVELGYMAAPEPTGPGMFALAPGSRLREVLDGAGFVEVLVEEIEVDRVYPGVDEYIAETIDLSAMFAGVWEKLDEGERNAVMDRVGDLTAPYRSSDGSVRLPGRSLGAAASA